MSEHLNRMRGFCTRCRNPGRDKCVELCPIAAEYVNKGYVGQAEYLPNTPLAYWSSILNPMPYRDMSQLNSETRKMLILMLNRDGKSSDDIAVHMECSRQYVEKIITNWKLLVRSATKFAPKYQILHR